MRFQMPEAMKDKDGHFPDAISVAGSSFEVDDTGVFEGPDLIADQLVHMNIKGANIPKANGLSKKEANPEPIITPPKPTAEEAADALIAGLTYEQLGEELTKMGKEVRNKKAERIEDLRAALLAPKA